MDIVVLVTKKNGKERKKETSLAFKTFIGAKSYYIKMAFLRHYTFNDQGSQITSDFFLVKMYEVQSKPRVSALQMGNSMALAPAEHGVLERK